MVTVRQIERLWNTEQFDHIISICMELRIEDCVRLRMELAASAPAAAAIAAIRLDELNQAHLPLYGRLLRAILAAQQPDGSWGDALPTALCLRALMCGSGDGLAIDRGLQFLASLQKSDGSWPKIAFRRMPADAFVSAFILFCLGDDDRFCAAVRVEDALSWLGSNAHHLDADSAQLWRAVSLRPGTAAFRTSSHVLS